MRIAIGFYVDKKHKWSGSSKELTNTKHVVSARTEKQNFRPTSGQMPKDWHMCYTVIYQFDRTVSLTATCVGTSFLFLLQGSEVLKEHHCSFVYAAKPSQCGVPE